MTKWVLKNRIIHTELYTEGMEDGFSCIPFVMTCEYQDINGKYKQCLTCTKDIKKKPFIQKYGYMSRAYINPNDLIVTDSNGTMYPESRKNLEEEYDEI